MLQHGTCNHSWQDKVRYLELRLHVEQMVSFLLHCRDSSFCSGMLGRTLWRRGAQSSPWVRLDHTLLTPPYQAPWSTTELPRRVSLHPSLLLPKHGRDLHRDYTSWSQNPFLRFSADGEEVFVVGRLFGPVSASVILDILPHLPYSGS